MTETWFTRMMTCESHSSGIQSSKVLRAMGVYPPSRVRGDHEAEGDEPPQSPHGECSGFVIPDASPPTIRSEEHTSELQSLMRTSYAVFCLKKKNIKQRTTTVTRLTYIK